MTRTDPPRRPPNPALLRATDEDEVVAMKPGDAVGRYRIAERIGSGGMAEVFRATLEGERVYRKHVVLKLVLPELAANHEYVELFIDEARLTAALAHPNLPQTYELGVHQGRHFIAMEYVSGVSLWKLVQRSRERGRLLPLDVSLKLIGQLLECLHYVHGATTDDGTPMRIVHRDVSPGNLLVTDEGAVKLLDFGIARARISEHHTAVGQVRGKMGYMSPEQCRGAALDHRTDLYATGTLLYLLTTGVGPFEPLGDFYQMVQACAAGNFPRPRAVQPSLHPDLEALILAALALEVEDRYPSAGAMLDALEALALSLRLMPRTRAVEASLRELFPERTPARARRRITTSRGMRATAPPQRPPSDLATEPQTAATPQRPPPPRLGLMDDFDPEDSSAATAREGFTPIALSAAAFPLRTVKIVAAVAIALLSLAAALFALSRQAPPPPPPPPMPAPLPLREFPAR